MAPPGRKDAVQPGRGSRPAGGAPTYHPARQAGGGGVVRGGVRRLQAQRPGSRARFHRPSAGHTQGRRRHRTTSCQVARRRSLVILLDTVVLSELRKSQPSAAVVQWLSTQRDSELFLSVVSLGEIERGIEKKRSSDPAFASVLERWLDDLVNLYGDRILPVSPPIARRWRSLSARIGNDSADLLIAATAITHGLHVATLNVRHFAPTGVG